MTSSRRDFLAQSGAAFSGAWLLAHLPNLEQLGLDARNAYEGKLPFETLTEAEARTMAAFAEQVIPSGTTPGAREAGAIYFIDKALGSIRKGALAPIRAGLKDLDARARKRDGKVASFADLSSQQQIAIMKQVEKSEFFEIGRTLTVLGVFADPKYGGNRDHAGFKLLGIDHKPVYQPPFGYYDARATGEPR